MKKSTTKKEYKSVSDWSELLDLNDEGTYLYVRDFDTNAYVKVNHPKKVNRYLGIDEEVVLSLLIGMNLNSHDLGQGDGAFPVSMLNVFVQKVPGTGIYSAILPKNAKLLRAPSNLENKNDLRIDFKTNEYLWKTRVRSHNKIVISESSILKAR